MEIDTEKYSKLFQFVTIPTSEVSEVIRQNWYPCGVMQFISISIGNWTSIWTIQVTFQIYLMYNRKRWICSLHFFVCMFLFKFCYVFFCFVFCFCFCFCFVFCCCFLLLLLFVFHVGVSLHLCFVCEYIDCRLRLTYPCIKRFIIQSRSLSIEAHSYNVCRFSLALLSLPSE